MEQKGLEAQESLMRMTIQITRKDTGKVEEYELIGYPEKDQLDNQSKKEQ